MSDSDRVNGARVTPGRGYSFDPPAPEPVPEPSAAPAPQTDYSEHVDLLAAARAGLDAACAAHAELSAQHAVLTSLLAPFADETGETEAPDAVLRRLVAEILAARHTQPVERRQNDPQSLTEEERAELARLEQLAHVEERRVQDANASADRSASGQ